MRFKDKFVDILELRLQYVANQFHTSIKYVKYVWTDNIKELIKGALL